MKNKVIAREFIPLDLSKELERKYSHNLYIKKYIKEQVIAEDIKVNLFVLEILINNFTNGSANQFNNILEVFYKNNYNYIKINELLMKIMLLDFSDSKDLQLTIELIEAYLKDEESMPLEWLLILEK